MLERKKILVTGGAGYIGSHTVVALHDSGYEPVIVDNYSNSKRGILARIATICGREFSHYECDVRDLGGMRRIFETEGAFFGVIHFAAFKAVGESVERPAEYYDNNLGALARLLVVMAEQGLPGLVFSSSCTVYGQPKELPVTEDSPLQPASSPYGYTKQAGEQLIADMVNSPRGLRAVTLRYFNPIGAHPSGLIGELPLGVPNNLVPFITQTAAGIRERLRIHGRDYPTPDGTAIRDFIHVVDLAKAHVMALEILQQRAGQHYLHIANVGTGQGHSVLEVVETFERVTGVSLPYEFSDRRPGDVEAVWASIDGDRIPGWSAELSLEDALLDAWKWQRNLASQPL
jgi:UDP-glucose 4-epimerase